MKINDQAFLRINQLVGKSRFLDGFGNIGAQQIIIVMMVIYVIADVVSRFPGKRLMFWPLAFLAAFWALGWLINLLIGLIIKHPRPYIVLPNVKKIFTPLMDWKTFPSDHAMSAFLIFFMALIFHLPFAWVLLPLAFWVCWGRVFSGVHYPLDILGGLAVASFCASLALISLERIF